MSDRNRADAVYAALLQRQGERWVQPRVERTRRVLELLDDPQRTYRVVHVTGTNGKTSTSRMIESLVRAHGLRTGLFTSPHLERFTERIMIDGEPIADGAIADAWDEVEPFVDLVDAELAAADDAPLTFFELLTVLAFVAFADAPVDVAVVEVGMGGSWDSTNTADGDVAVIAPIDLDHADRLGETIADIAAVKAGIIKDGAAVVSARQDPTAEAVLRAAAAARGATIAFEGADFGLASGRLAVGGQLISVRGLAGTYDDEYLPLYGAHQGFNAALAIAAVESLVGGASQAIAGDILDGGAQPDHLARPTAARRHQPDRARRRRAQPARRTGARPPRSRSRSPSTSGASCSASSPTRTPPASSRPSPPSRRTCSPRRRSPIAPTTPTASPTSPSSRACPSPSTSGSRTPPMPHGPGPRHPIVAPS